MTLDEFLEWLAQFDSASVHYWPSDWPYANLTVSVKSDKARHSQQIVYDRKEPGDAADKLEVAMEEIERVMTPVERERQ